MKYFRFSLMPVLLIGLFYMACSDLGVQGFVIDVLNNRPVDGAVVKITDTTATKKTYYTVTINGYFDIDIDQSFSKVHELEFYIVKGGCIPLNETSTVKDSLIFFMICQ
jgi:hypothetical protein